jgi:glucose/arabinose dehydrogenase
MLRALMVSSILALSTPALAQGVAAQRLNQTSFARPILVTQPEGEHARVWVVNQTGVINLMDAITGVVNSTPFLTVPSVRYGGEGGLLGMAFHPDYATNGYFFLYYNRAGATIAADARVIIRYQRDANNPNLAEPASATVIWSHTVSTSNHNGGWIAFGPDRNLYIAWGEHGQGTNAPDITDNPLGKIHRLDIDGPDNLVGTPDDDQFPEDDNKNYAIPQGNPFVGIDGDDEIWAYGLRNPWRNSFDKLTGELYIADVGSGAWEEVDVAPAPPAAPGRHYGWNCMEGLNCIGSQTNPACICNSANLTLPAHVYSSGGTPECAISGGYVYRGCAMPWHYGAYFFGDYCSGKVWTSRYNGTQLVDVTDITAQVWSLAPRPVIYSFGQDSAGELYICGGANVYKLVPTGVPSQCGCGSADYNGDGDFGTDQDIEVFFRCLAGDCPLFCDIWCSDFNGDGDFGTDQDIEAFFRVLAGGYC